MSHFQRSNGLAEYTEKMRTFLGMPVHEFKSTFGLKKEDESKSQKGRFKSYVYKDKLAEIERACNKKAQKTLIANTFASRLDLAISYSDRETVRDFKDTAGISKESIRQWLNGPRVPKGDRLMRIAEGLNVSAFWLTTGEDHYLSADSRIGQLVGDLLLSRKQELRDETIKFLRDKYEDLSIVPVDTLRDDIEFGVYTDRNLKKLARQCGGRWQFVETNQRLDDDLLFSPWEMDTKKNGRHDVSQWPAAVELIIKNELIKPQSTYKAHEEIQRICAKEGLPCPRRVSIYKRVQRVKNEISEFGIDLSYWSSNSNPLESRAVYC